MNFRPMLFLPLLLTFAANLGSVRAAENVTQIKLQHTPCEGPCPIDELTLNADGSAQFAGEAYSARTGFYRGHIAPEKFAVLAHALEEQNFFELRPEIGDSLTADAPDAIVSATREGSLLDKPHTVIFRASGNRALLDQLQAAFAAASAQIEWEKDELASNAGARGTLTRDLTAYETRLFAYHKPAFTELRMRYALVKLISMEDTKIVYATRTDGEGKFQIFAPPGRYLLSANDLNAADPIEYFPYLPQWLSDGVLIEVTPDQFVPIAFQLHDYNEAHKPKN